MLLIRRLQRLQGKEVEDEIKHYQNAVFSFEGRPNAEKMLNFEVKLTDMVNGMIPHFGGIDPMEVSVFRFYSMVQKLNKDAKAQTK